MNSNLAISSRSCRKLSLYSCFSALTLLILSSIKFPQGVRHIIGVSDSELNVDALVAEADHHAVRTHITVTGGNSTQDGHEKRITEMAWTSMRNRSSSDFVIGRKLLSTAAASGAEEGYGWRSSSAAAGGREEGGRRRRGRGRRRKRGGVFVKKAQLQQQQQQLNKEEEEKEMKKMRLDAATGGGSSTTRSRAASTPAAAAAAADVDESASFHVDYSGPKTHPPKNN